MTRAGKTPLVLPALRRDQSIIALHPARIKVVACGRRWGKSFMATTIALACANQGAAVAWVVPTYKNSRPVWRIIERTVAPLVRAKLVYINRAERTVEFPSGGWIGVYSADNDTAMRGESFDLIIGDEASRFPETTFEEVLQPTLADRDGRCLLLSTPRGRNWFWRLYEQGQDPDNAGYIKSWRRPTKDNPIPSIRRAAELARQKVPQRTYEQEWLAQFLVDGGLVFRNVDKLATVRPGGGPQAWHSYVMGVDFGKRGDYTVLTIVDATAQSVVYLDRFNEIDYTIQLDKLEKVAKRWNPLAIIVERNNIGEPLIDFLGQTALPIVPFHTTNATKAVLVDKLALAMEQERIGLLDDPILKSELKAFEATLLPSGLTRYAAPEGFHDDTVLSLLFAWSAAESTAAGTTPATADPRQPAYGFRST